VAFFPFAVDKYFKN